MFLTLNAFISMTFREAIRNKILYGIGFFAIAIFLFSLVLGELSLYEQERVIRDVGMTFMMLMGIALAMYTGIGQIHREIDRRIIYTILSKPVRRYQIVIGKFLGIAVTLFVEMFAMFAIFLALLAIRGMVIDPTLFEAFWLSYMESLVVAAAALMFSTFSSAMLSTLMCTGFVLLASRKALRSSRPHARKSRRNQCRHARRTIPPAKFRPLRRLDTSLLRPRNPAQPRRLVNTPRAHLHRRTHQHRRHRHGKTRFRINFCHPSIPSQTMRMSLQSVE